MPAEMDATPEARRADPRDRPNPNVSRHESAEHGPTALVQLGGSNAEGWAQRLADDGSEPVPVLGPKDLFDLARRGDGTLAGAQLALIGEPPSAGIGTAAVTLAAARLRPSSVLAIDARDSTLVRRSLRSHLARTALPACRQMALSSLGVAAQRLVARGGEVREPRLARLAAELGQVTYLRPLAGIPSRVGGSVTHSHGVIRALTQLGVEVQPFTTDPYIVETAASDVEPPCSWRLVPVADAWKALPASAAFGGDLALLRAAIHDARRSELIYQRHNRFSLVGAMLARMASRPLFLEYNGPEGFFDQAWHDNPLGAQLEACEQASLRAATRIIVNSRVDLRSLEQQGIPSERLIFSPNGVEAERFGLGGGEQLRRQLSVGPNELLLGFVGSFGAWHGAPVLAQAFGKIREAGLPVRLLLVGDGPDRVRVESLIRAGGAADAAILAGMVSPEAIPQHLDACDVLVSPHVQLPGGQEFFGSPTKLFEYMAAGKAIVASRLGQIGEVLEHERTALLVPPGDVDALAAAIESLVGDPELRVRLGSAAREVAIARHSWRNNAQHVIDGYRDWRTSREVRS
jgi:glycosyltransferase involved in cell wall biosynthesis